MSENFTSVLLSVVIPVFNWNIAKLLSALFEESAHSRLGRLEIIVADDCTSDEVVKAENRQYFAEITLPYLRSIEMQTNLGRSAVRNRLAGEARGEYLLFVDCDVLPDAGNFLATYLKHAAEGVRDVVCGGISYRTRIRTEPEYDFHAYLGTRKEVKAAAERNLAPWRYILTSNIMVRKSVFLATSFNERFSGYGYEDIEWGVRLAEKYRILHIDNTASHLGLVSKATAYDKMCNSVPNYLLLRELCPAAFSASAISRLVGLLAKCDAALLDLLDRSLKRRFLGSRSGNGSAFFLFQLNFAVLLARTLKKSSRAATRD